MRVSHQVWRMLFLLFLKKELVKVVYVHPRPSTEGYYRAVSRLPHSMRTDMLDAILAHRQLCVSAINPFAPSAHHHKHLEHTHHEHLVHTTSEPA